MVEVEVYYLGLMASKKSSSSGCEPAVMPNCEMVVQRKRGKRNAKKFVGSALSRVWRARTGAQTSTSSLSPVAAKFVPAPRWGNSPMKRYPLASASSASASVKGKALMRQLYATSAPFLDPAAVAAAAAAAMAAAAAVAANYVVTTWLCANAAAKFGVRQRDPEQRCWMPSLSILPVPGFPPPSVASLGLDPAFAPSEKMLARMFYGLPHDDPGALSKLQTWHRNRDVRVESFRNRASKV